MLEVFRLQLVVHPVIQTGDVAGRTKTRLLRCTKRQSRATTYR